MSGSGSSDGGGDSQEKTEQASEQKKQKARKKGQVPRSKELVSFMVMFMAVFGFLIYGHLVSDKLHELFTLSFTFTRDELFSESNNQFLINRFMEIFGTSFSTIIPFMLLLVFVAIIASIALGGMTFSVEKVKFDPKKLGLLKGLKRMVSMQALMELLKSVLKAVLIISVGALYMYFMADRLIELPKMAVNDAIREALFLVMMGLLTLTCSLIVLVLVDVPFQLFQHSKQLMMSRQEQKDEYKETEGKPEVKAKIRQQQQQMREARMMSDVPKADVIITNPTHFAVALTYDDLSPRAPVCVAKGVDFLAQKIREVAEAHDVPILEAPPLARSIYHTTEIDAEIPEGLYVAVAQVLAYVFQLKTHKARRGKKPKQPKKFDIPDDLKH